MRKEELTAIKAEVSQILFEIWDPIGVSDMIEDEDDPEAIESIRSEYSYYEDPIVGMVVRGADEKEIAIALEKYANERMEIHNACDRACAAAKALVAVRERTSLSE